ncbi:MAG: enoyl-CoA hydratase/isomerase family protein [Dehalococcoidales bacterium]|nr:enoyl-CoA hydratase/isomerase family protein [Dehalococcoidales bacterium]
MSAFETIIYEKQSHKGYITLNRPRVLNVYNVRMRDELYEILSAVKDDPEVRVVILKGAGEKAFCAGADLKEFLTAPPPVQARRIRFQRDVWSLFLSLEKPVIADIHGYCLGSGIEMAMCCDLRLASADAQFGVPEMGLGIIPAAGGSQTIPRIIGRGHALEMLFSGRYVNAPEALKMKLVNRVVSRAELLPAVETLADKIAGYKPEAVRSAKQAVTRGLELPLAQGLALEARLGYSLRCNSTPVYKVAEQAGV